MEGRGRPSDLELVLLDDALREVLLQLVYDGHHRDVRLAGAGRRADQQVLVGAVRSREHHRLDAIEGRDATKGHLPDLYHTQDKL